MNNKISKVDIKKMGLNTIEDEVVQQNLMGRSRKMGKKDWVDASGRKGTVSTKPAIILSKNPATVSLSERGCVTVLPSLSSWTEGSGYNQIQLTNLRCTV
jgi:hypothetical protein